MKKLITAALLVAVATPVVAIPTAASAQSNRSHHGNRHDARQDHRETVHDRDRNWRDNDWSDWRRNNRNLFARGSWNAPFRYQSFRPGARIGVTFYAPRFRIGDPWRYHLPRPGYNQVWVRHYNDLLLIDMRRGIVIRVIRGFYW